MSSNPRRIIENALDLVMVLARARRGAVLSCQDGRMSLVASRGLDQSVLNNIQRVWSCSHRSLVARTPLYSEGTETFLALPCLEKSELVGVLYVDTPGPSFRLPTEHLATFSGIFGRAIRSLSAPSTPQRRDWAIELDHAAPDDLERERLLLLLTRNEWNISRVARILNVTRMTVYNRLVRFNIPRERVAKTQRRVRV